MALPRCFELIFGTLRYSAMRCFAVPVLEPKTTRTTLREGLAALLLDSVLCGALPFCAARLGALRYLALK